MIPSTINVIFPTRAYWQRLNTILTDYNSREIRMYMFPCLSKVNLSLSVLDTLQ